MAFDAPRASPDLCRLAEREVTWPHLRPCVNLRPSQSAGRLFVQRGIEGSMVMLNLLRLSQCCRLPRKS